MSIVSSAITSPAINENSNNNGKDALQDHSLTNNETAPINAAELTGAIMKSSFDKKELLADAPEGASPTKTGDPKMRSITTVKDESEDAKHKTEAKEISKMIKAVKRWRKDWIAAAKASSKLHAIYKADKTLKKEWQGKLMEMDVSPSQLSQWEKALEIRGRFLLKIKEDDCPWRERIYRALGRLPESKQLAKWLEVKAALESKAITLAQINRDIDKEVEPSGKGRPSKKTPATIAVEKLTEAIDALRKAGDEKAAKKLDEIVSELTTKKPASAGKSPETPAVAPAVAPAETAVKKIVEILFCDSPGNLPKGIKISTEPREDAKALADAILTNDEGR